MMSPRGQLLPSPQLPTATSMGEVPVQEYGYGLGPPTGILVLRYPPSAVVADFPEARNDFVHQVFWSPDGILTVRRGANARFISSSEMLWVRAGVVADVRGLGSQTVLRTCVRRAPTALTEHAAAVLRPDGVAHEQLLGLARPGVAESSALCVREQLLSVLSQGPATPVDHAAASDSPAHAVSQALLAEPANSTSLVDWADRLHVSPKTLQRDLGRTFGVNFTTLRTQIRLRAAIAHLGSRSVTETAHLVGYATASAFVAAFTREYGASPARYVASHHAPAPADSA